MREGPAGERAPDALALSAFDARARGLVMGAVVALAVLAVIGRIGLYADGSFLFWRMLLSTSVEPDPARAWVGAAMQAPLAIALRIGVSDPTSLHRIFTAGLVLTTGAAWASALWIHRRTPLFWLLAVAWSSVYLNTGLFALSEFNLTYAILALMIATLTRPGDLTARRAAAVLGMAVILIKGYESVLIVGPAVAWLAWTTARARRTRAASGPGTGARILGGAAVVLLVAAGWALHSVMTRDGEAAFLHLFAWLIAPRVLLSTGAAVAIMIGLGLGGGDGAVRLHRAAMAVVGFLVVWLIAFEDMTSPKSHYHNRIFVALPMVALAIQAGRMRFGGLLPGSPLAPSVGPTPSRWVLVSVALTLVMGAEFASRTVGFGRYLARLEEVVREGHGVVPWAAVGPIDEAYVWEWAVPVLSLSLQGPPRCAVILPPERYQGWLAGHPMEHLAESGCGSTPRS